MVQINNNFMKVFLTALILIFSLQSWTKADDIRDFQIEGMSIGDSALDFFTKEQIEAQKKVWYPSKEYFVIDLPIINNNLYDRIGASFKNNDNKYFIKSLAGTIFYQNNFNECLSLKDQIVKDLSDLFNDIAEKDDVGIFKLSADDTGKSTANTFNFIFYSGDLISVQCKDWSEAMNLYDRLKVTIVSKEYFEFTQRAYD